MLNTAPTTDGEQAHDDRLDVDVVVVFVVVLGGEEVMVETMVCLA